MTARVVTIAVAVALKAAAREALPHYDFMTWWRPAAIFYGLAALRALSCRGISVCRVLACAESFTFPGIEKNAHT